MNENYLWDKTGNDSEIENLESALQIFRCAETVAPALPAKTIRFKLKNRRNIFRPGFAFAACAILIVVGAGVWSLFSNNALKTDTDSAEVIAPQNSAPVIEQPIIENSIDLAVKKIKALPVKAVELSNQSPPKQKILKTRKNVSEADLKNKIIVRKAAPTETVAQLSDEEKYAYNQLMLALSITSSKLKIVKDKIENLEKPNSVLKTENKL